MRVLRQTQCPKCGEPLMVHVALMLCADAECVPMCDDELVMFLFRGLVKPSGVVLPLGNGKLEVHCSNCDWKGLRKALEAEPEVPQEPEPAKEPKPLSKLLN